MHTSAFRACILAAASLPACAASQPSPASTTSASTNATPVTAADAPYVAPPIARRMNVAIVLYQSVELLDFAGPAEVFSSSSAFHPYTVATTHAPILSQGLVTVTPRYSIDDAPTPDIVVIPGGGVETVLKDDAMKAWLGKRVAEDELTMSVCNGALALAGTGALDGLTATTHWGAAADLAAVRDRKISVLPGERYIDHGHVMTTAGISAGIDGALHVVERYAGEESAWKVARYMQYDWSPEEGSIPGRAPLTPERREAMRAAVFHDWPAAARDYAAIVHRVPGDAHAHARLGRALVGLGQVDDGIRELARARELGQSDDETMKEYATALMGQKRWDEAAKAFASWAEVSEAGRATAYYDMACSLARGGRAEDAFTALENAAKAGFSAAAFLEGDGDLQSLRKDARFEKIVAEVRATRAAL